MSQIFPSLPGYEHIPKKWDRSFNISIAKVVPGEFYVTTNDEAIETTLGSCIACCVRDRINGVGGLNHFMLPQSAAANSRAKSDDSYGKEGDWAMEFLINGVLLNGGERRNLEVKYFGGAQMLEGLKGAAIGERNIAFVREYLLRERLKVVSSDVGGDTPRKVLYFPSTGKVKLKKISRENHRSIAGQEDRYAGKLVTHDKQAGSIELF